MSNRVQFILEANAQSVLRAQDAIIAKQKQTEQALGRTATAAETANRRIATSSRQAASAVAAGVYDMAPLGGTASAGVRAVAARGRATGVRTYGLAPMPPAVVPMVGGGVTIPRGSGGIYRTDDEAFTRWTRAQTLRRQRSQARDMASAAARGRMAGIVSGAMLDMDLDGSRRRRRAADLQSEIDLNNFALKVEKQRRGGALRRGLNSPVGGMVAGYIGAQQAINLVGNVVSGIGQHYRSMADGAMAFEAEMTGLVNVSEKNLDNIAGVKRRVLATTIARGFDRAEVVNARYNLEQTASNLDPRIMEEAWQQGQFLTKVKGGDLDTNTTAIVKVLQNYGSQFDSTQHAAAMLSAIEEQGSISMAELAEDAPDVLPGFKIGGYTFEDFGAITQIATAKLGKNNKTMRQSRRFFSMLLDAQKELDIQFTSTDMVEQVMMVKEALGKLNHFERADKIKKIGDAEGMVLLQTILDEADQLDPQRKAFGSVIRTKLFDAQVKRMDDSAYSSTQVMAGLQKIQENAPALLAAENPEKLKAMEFYEATLAGLALESPWIGEEQRRKDAALKTTKFATGGWDDLTGKEARLGFEKLYNAAVQAADGAKTKEEQRELMFQAEQMRMRWGEVFDLRDTDDTFMNEADAAEVRRLYNEKGHLVTPAGLADYHKIGWNKITVGNIGRETRDRLFLHDPTAIGPGDPARAEAYLKQNFNNEDVMMARAVSAEAQARLAYDSAETKATADGRITEEEATDLSALLKNVREASEHLKAVSEEMNATAKNVSRRVRDRNSQTE